jgi:hypothetical protein
MIFVVSIAMLEKVRLGSDRPSDVVTRYVCAPTDTDVANVVRNWCDRQGLPFKHIQRKTPAQRQDLRTYKEPAEMIGITI